MKKGDANLQEIAFVIDHANYQSLESYLAAPDDEDFERYNDMMFNYASNKKKLMAPNDENPTPKNNKSRLKLKCKPTATVSKPPEEDEDQDTTPKKNYNEIQTDLASKENSPPPTQMVPYQNELTTPVLEINNIQPVQQNKNILQFNICQSPSVFQGAIFNNCTIKFQMPQN